VRRLFRPGYVFTLGAVLFVIAAAAFFLPSNEYIFLPDPAHPVAPLVTIPGGKDPRRGGIYFVDIVVRKATLAERLFGGLHEGADLYPASAVNPPGVNDTQRRQIDLQDMRHSQQVAAAVALKAAGKRVIVRPVGAQIEAVESGKPAFGKLQPDDVILAVDGRRVRTLADVHNAMSKHHVGDTVAFTVTRAGHRLIVPLKTVDSDTRPRRPVVGVLLQPAIDIHLPFPVRINSGDIGGPSAGLAFALDLYVELGHAAVLHGAKVAATGEIFPDGSVGPIGGIKQKTIGARESHVDAFLVPAGENAAVARKYAKGLRIIAVKSFQQALHALATLRNSR
jgi:PDZ domain-containing protein